MGLKGLPLSLGLRPQAMRLKLATAGTPGGFIKPTRMLHDVMPQTDRSSWKKHCNLFIGETISLVYSPMVIKNTSLYDAVLDRLVASWKPEDQYAYPPEPIDQEIRFVPALCPQCGWDLQGEADALVLICKNCESAWSCEDGRWEKVSFAVLPGTTDPVYYLPFWRIKAQISGLQAASWADLSVWPISEGRHPGPGSEALLFLVTGIQGESGPLFAMVPSDDDLSARRGAGASLALVPLYPAHPLPPRGGRKHLAHAGKRHNG